MRGFEWDVLAGLRVRIPPAAWIHVYCECCVLSGGGRDDPASRGDLPIEQVTECHQTLP